MKLRSDYHESCRICVKCMIDCRVRVDVLHIEVRRS